MLPATANRGCALEDLVETIFSADPESAMHRQNNKWVPLHGGKAGAFPSRGAPIDFVGVIRGVPVALECKECGAPRFPLSEARFPQKEKDALLRFIKAGGKSFLLVWFWKSDALAVYPVADVLAFLKEGKKSLTPGDAASVLSVGEMLKLPARLVSESKAGGDAVAAP